MTKKTPGPLAPPVTSLPSLKMTALSYSWTTFTMKKRENGRVPMMRRQEKTFNNSANRLGPSSHTAQTSDYSDHDHHCSPSDTVLSGEETWTLVKVCLRWGVCLLLPPVLLILRENVLSDTSDTSRAIQTLTIRNKVIIAGLFLCRKDIFLSLKEMRSRISTIKV